MHGMQLGTQKVNSVIGMIFLGSVALGAIVLMLYAAEMSNPLEDIMEKRMNLPEEK